METLDGLLFELDDYSAINVERLIADKVENIFVRVGLEKTDNRVEADYMKVYRSSAEGEEIEAALSLHEHLKSLLKEYLDTWGDSEDMRLAVILIASGLDFISIEEFQACVTVLGDIQRSGFPPASLVAAGVVAKELEQQTNSYLWNSGGTKLFAAKGRPLFETWHQGLQRAWGELELDSIENSPVEVFEEFLRPHITELFEEIVERKEWS